MKKIALMAFFLLICVVLVYGQHSGSEKSEGLQLTAAFIGLGPELNLSTRSGPAAGAFLNAGFEFGEKFAVGIRAAFGHDFNTVASLETALLLRYYFPLGDPSSLFAEINAGIKCYFEHEEAFPAPLISIGVGYIFKLGDRFYLEPLVRAGHPFTLGASLALGILF